MKGRTAPPRLPPSYLAKFLSDPRSGGGGRDHPPSPSKFFPPQLRPEAPTAGLPRERPFPPHAPAGPGGPAPKPEPRISLPVLFTKARSAKKNPGKWGLEGPKVSSDQPRSPRGDQGYGLKTLDDKRSHPPDRASRPGGIAGSSWECGKIPRGTDGVGFIKTPVPF